MRVICRHGHYAFYPRRAGDLAAFVNRFSQELVSFDDYFTFPLLAGAKEYSLKGANFLNLPATETFAGKPWEIMKANGFVYNIQTKLLVQAASIIASTNVYRTGLYYTSESSLIQAGSLNAGGVKLLSYDGEYNSDDLILRLREFSSD